jgi:lysophospholipase L1-like esterase
MRRGFVGTIWGITIFFFMLGFNPAWTQYRIMLLGDEITSGTTSGTPEGGYRDNLATLFDGASISYNFVGNLSTGTGFDNDHEGHDYFTADLVDANILTWINNLGDEFPRFFMLHIGSADVTQNQSNETTIQEIENIVDKIYNNDNAHYIFLCSLIPRKDAKDGTTTQLNTLIQTLITEKKNAGYNILYVGQNEAFKVNPNWATLYMEDDYHPNNAGYQVMAQVYFNVFIAATMDLDFGDLPASYHLTTLADDGARHEIGSVFLGSAIDSETDGQVSANAGQGGIDGDDGTDTDDEDGIKVHGSWYNGVNGGAIDVTVTGGAGYLSGWINWQGVWEQILDMQLVVSGTQTVQFDIPQGAIPGYGTYDRFARFRLVTSNSIPLTLTGLFGTGEVEDYYLTYNSGESDMDVEYNSEIITDGDTTPSTLDGTDFGSTNLVSGSVDHTFTIRNSGVVNLDLTGTPKVFISGTNASDFVVMVQPSSPVAINGATTFTIRFDPSAIALRTATVFIENNDEDKNPYNFVILGTGSNNRYFPVEPTGDAQPVIVTGIQIDGQDIGQGDDIEIGVFDGTLCVGAFEYTGQGFAITVTTWKQVIASGVTLPGGKPGHSMIFKLWDSVESTEFDATPTYEAGSTGKFDTDQITICSLVGNRLEHFTSIVEPTGDAHPVIIEDTIINEHQPLAIGDEIAIYDGTLCVGVTKWSGEQPITVTTWLEVNINGITLPGATNGNSMSFRVWDKSLNNEFLAIPTYGERSQGVLSEGKFGEDPYTVVTALSGTMRQTIPISHSMRNIISFNVQPQNTGIDFMLDDLETLLIAQNDAGEAYIPDPIIGTNTIGSVDFSKGYKVYMIGTNDDNIVNDGLPLVPQSYQHHFFQRQLYTIGYPYQNAHLVEGVFAAISSKVVVVKDHDGKFWIPQYGVNTIGYMQPGKGYDIFVNVDQTLTFTFPALTSNLAKTNYSEDVVPNSNHFLYEKTGLSYGVVVTNSEEKLSASDEIGVFAENLCVGAAVYEGEFPLVIPAWEGDPQYELIGFKKGQNISFKVWKADVGKLYDIGATFANKNESGFAGGPISVAKLQIVGEQESAMPNRFVLEQNYPNPFNPETTISYQLATASKINLTIYNMEGKVVRRIESGTRDAGSYKIKWNGLDDTKQQVSSGVYFYRLDANEFSSMKKMILIK